MGIASPGNDRVTSYGNEPEPVRSVDMAAVQSLFALFLLVAGTAGATVSVGIWLGWAAGGATLSVVAVVLGFRLANDQ